MVSNMVNKPLFFNKYCPMSLFFYDEKGNLELIKKKRIRKSVDHALKQERFKLEVIAIGISFSLSLE